MFLWFFLPVAFSSAFGMHDYLPVSGVSIT